MRSEATSSVEPITEFTSATPPLTDEQKKAALKAGKLHFVPPPPNGKDSDEAKASRTIQASWLEELAQEPARICDKAIDITNAIIEGRLNLKYATFEYGLSITDSEFTGPVNLSFARFKRSVTFSGSQFHRFSTFRAAHATFDFNVDRAQFPNNSSFADLQVDETLSAKGASFGSVNFSRINVVKDAYFRLVREGKELIPVRIAGEARFMDAHIQGSIWFDGAQFADKANFTRVQIGSSAFFRVAQTDDKNIPLDDKAVATSFGGEAIFFEAHVAGTADFNGAQFKDKANFNGIDIGGQALFRTGRWGSKIIPICFGGEASFQRAHIHKTAEFDGAHFRDKANFNLVVIDGNAFFRTARFDDKAVPISFGGEAIFSEAQVRGTAEFSGAQFKDKANFSRIQIAGSAFFRAIRSGSEIIPIRFDGETTFSGAQIVGNADFQGAQFNNRADFNLLAIGGNALFRTARFGDKTGIISFGGETIFLEAHIAGTAEFTGAQFKDKANFNRIQIGGSAFFNAILIGTDVIPIRFGGETNFKATRIGETADFNGAQFKDKANFNRIQIGGSAFFNAILLGTEVIPVRFGSETTFIGARIVGSAEFQGAQFSDKADLSMIAIGGNAVFRTANFGDKTITTTFDGEAIFLESRIAGTTVFNGAQFKDKANFNGIDIGGQAVFRAGRWGSKIIPVRFGGETTFLRAHIQKTAEFDGAQFQDIANFNLIVVDGNAHFRTALFDDKALPISFGGEAIFSEAHIAGTAEFNGAQFKDKANFVHIQIGGNALFNTLQIGSQIIPTRFDDETTFFDARIRGTAEFQGAKFKDKTNFGAIKISGIALFRAAHPGKEVIPIRFGGETTFLGAHVEEAAEFDGAQFVEQANFTNIQIGGNALFRGVRFGGPSVFYGAYFKGQADFQRAYFEKRVEFNRCQIEGSALFQDAVFTHSVNLRVARFHAVFFRHEDAKQIRANARQQFNGPVDMRGFTYESINVDWPDLSHRLSPYDRQPYVQIEKILRSTGNDREADNVYLDRRKRENQQRWVRIRGKLDDEELSRWQRFLELLRALFDSFQRMLFGFGVRSIRLLWISLIVIAIGVLMFSRPGAVKPKEKEPQTEAIEKVLQTYKLEKKEGADGAQKDKPSEKPESLTITQALGVSLRLFIPIVEIPSGSQWMPSEKPAPVLEGFGLSFAGYATLHRLAGAILVPLGVAALTGMLYRRVKT